MRKNIGLFGIALIALCHLSIANAVIFPFQIFTNNGQYNDNPGAVFTVDVSNDAGNVNFTFYNESVFDCSISNIYFDGGPLLSILDITNGPGTGFSIASGGPGNLPGGNTLNPPFIADKEFSIGAVKAPPKNGINSFPDSEWLQIKFDLANGYTFQDVIDDLNTGELRIGIHVISFPDGSSESGVNTPEPATIALLGLGLVVLIRNKKS